VMTINQVNIASTFSFISRDFDSSIYGLGILTSAFFLAYGAFEVPGGILAARIGPKKIVVYGAVANTIGVFGSGLSPQFGLLTLFRFTAGFGFAFAFPSILVLIVRYYKKGSEGFGVGLMSVSTALGSVAGLFGWAVLAEVAGWRQSLLGAGALDLSGVIVMATLIPADRISPHFSLKIGHLREIITNRALAVLRIGSAYGLVINFMVYYLEQRLGFAPGTAGLISSATAVLPIISAPVMGRVFDRIWNVKALLLVPAGIITVGVGLASIDSVYAALATVTLVGLASGAVFCVGLATPWPGSTASRSWGASRPRSTSPSWSWAWAIP
jgi:MFS family permease